MTREQLISEKITWDLADSEAKAWDSLGKYKFLMFGYHAANWVRLNRLAGLKRPNPWRRLVHLAREQQP